MIASCVLPSEGANERFVARLASGERVAGDNLTGWDRRGGELKLDNTSLQGEQPFHWLKDQDRVPPNPKQRPAHIEMQQGDILPGVIVGYEAPKRLPATPGHFVVACNAVLQPPPTANELPVRVKSNWVKRIVFSSNSGEPLEASQLRLRDGKVVSFRAIRLEPTGVVALGESGRSRLRWAELGEIRFPDLNDPWIAHWQQLALLTPEGDGQLLELHTEDHLAVTTSLSRLAFPESSKGPDADAWVHGAHPVWALDAIWVPSRSVWMRVAYAPHQLPLSRAQPANFVHRPTLGVKRHWQRDRSVLGDSLLTADGPAGWGIGVHSYSKISFELPSAARRLKGTVALDITAGLRGCVKASVSADGSQRFASNYLVGAQSADFDLELANGSRKADSPISLTLEVDSADANRPANADPLDVRDQTNWLDVLVTFDEQLVREQCRALASDMIAAWQGWTFIGDGETQWVSEWDGLAASPGAFVNRLASADAVTLARSIRRRATQRYLVISVSNADSKEPATLEVHSGGDVLLRRNVPERSPRNPSAPLIVASLDTLPLDEPRDLVVVIHSNEPISLHWQALAITDTHPEYTQLFDDQEHPQAIEDRDAAYAGPRAYRISPGKPLRHTFPEPMPFRYRPNIGESRYLRFAVSTPGKSLLAFRIKLAGENQPLLYDLGQGPLTEGRARRIYTSALSKKWLPVSRDLCGDLRDDVEWIEFFVPEGMGDVHLDQAYVGRGGGGAWNDLETPLVSPWHDEEQRQLRVKDLTPRIGAGIVGLQFEDGRTAEGFVLQSKLIVTLGEVAPLDGSVRVTTADGKQFEGKLLGVSRTNNWALIESTAKESLPAPPPRLDGAAPIPFEMVMVECGAGGREATAIIAGPLPSNRIRSLAPRIVAPTVMGRPVLAAGGHIVGLRADRQQTRYVSLMNLAAAVNDLRKSERRGKWLLGEGPHLGFKLRWSEMGAVMGDVSASARAAGIQSGDILAQIDGQDVRDSWSAHRAICERDPGQEVTLQVYRGSEPTRDIKIRLAFR